MYDFWLSLNFVNCSVYSRLRFFESLPLDGPTSLSCDLPPWSSYLLNSLYILLLHIWLLGLFNMWGPMSILRNSVGFRLLPPLLLINYQIQEETHWSFSYIFFHNCRQCFCSHSQSLFLITTACTLILSVSISGPTASLMSSATGFHMSFFLYYYSGKNQLAWLGQRSIVGRTDYSLYSLLGRSGLKNWL